MALTLKQRSHLLAGPYTRLLADHEEAVQKLYESLAALFPRQASFWLSFAREEKYHRNIILSLERRMQEGSWQFIRPSFSSGRVMESINWINALRGRVDRTGMSMAEALRLMLQAERSMIETRFFEVLGDDIPETSHVLKKLAEYTRKHAAKLEKESKRLKWRLTGWRFVAPRSSSKSASAVPDRRARIQSAQTEIIGMLIAMEEAVGRLYAVYAGRLSNSSAFWDGMSKEEQKHAAMLHKLLDTVAKGATLGNLGAFGVDRIQTNIESIMHAENHAKTDEFTGAAAFNTALSIEQSMVESNFYGTVTSDAPEFRVIARRLIDLTKEHIEHLRKHSEDPTLRRESSLPLPPSCSLLKK